MDNEKKMADIAAEIVQGLMEAKTAGQMPENAVRLEMTPEKIPALAKLFPREMVEKSVGTFIGTMVMKFYGWDGEGEPELVKRADQEDGQAMRILSVIHVLSEAISYDLKGMQYDWGNEDET
jgi:hypothetical protein